MEGTEIETRVRRPEHEPLQFSLATVLLVVTISAVCLSVVFYGPEWLRGVLVVTLVTAVPVILTVLLVYARGYMRTFSIGALFPAGSIFFGISLFVVIEFVDRARFDPVFAKAPPTGVAILIMIYCATLIAFGLLAVVTRWRLEAPPRESQLQTQPYWDDLPAEESQPGEVCE